jgi:sugar phosphate isomerase/epimerase
MENMMRKAFKEPAFLILLATAVCIWTGHASQKSEAELMVRFGVCDWTIGKTGDPAALELASKLGLEGVQVSLAIKNNRLELAQAALQKSYLEAAKKQNIEIASFAMGDLNNIPYKSDPRAEQWIDQSIDICRAMKVKIVLVPFFGKGDLRNDPKGTETVIDRLKRVAPKAEKAGVILALESWLSAEDHLKILKAVGSPALQVYYDVGNSQEAGYDILKEIRLLGARICQFHAKDYKDLYGKGTMDFKAVRKAMEDIGYHSWFVLEGTELPLGVEKSIRYDLDYLRTIFPTR